ncbi:MAG: peptide deformylase [bacterium]|nr:peptide deformylase [bacterium]
MTDKGVGVINNKKELKLLRKKVALFDFKKHTKKDIDALLKKMRTIMHESYGVGLSANQIGIDMHVFVAHVEGKFYAVFNSALTKISDDAVTFEEGCLSVPEVFGAVARPDKVTLEGYDKSGKKIKIRAWGLLARVFQHEIDHLNGTVFIDKATDLYTYASALNNQKSNDK